MPKSQVTSKIIHGVQFPIHWGDYLCLFWLYQFAPRLQANPYWRPDVPNNPASKTLDGNPAQNPYTGEGRFQHARELSSIFFPKAFEWHDWSERVVRASCESNLLAVTGCGTSGKSTDFGLEAFNFWACAPLDTAVILVSTTLESAKKRIWKETSRLYGAFSRALGGYRGATIGSSPRPYISPYKIDEPTKRDEAHGIYVTALQKKSNTDEEMEYIKGFHPRRIMMVIDEMDSLREHGKALWEIFIGNLSSGTIEAKFVALGNDPSLFNQLGELMQREKGKPISIADTEWTSIHGVKCLRLDAWDSPNIRHDNKFTGLIRQADIDRIVTHTGPNSPSVWVQLHGLHPPEGSDNTVLSEASMLRFHCREQVTWQRDVIISGMVDPGFGGDPCIFRTSKRGTDKDGKFRIFWDEVIEIPISANDPQNPAEYQIAAKVQELCKARSIPPDEFIIGSTGTGRGAAAVLQREWSPKILLCEEGGAASDRIMSDEDPRPAHEVCDRRVTELYFSIREFVQADIMRGIDNPTALQLCQRTWEEKGTGRGLRRSLQKKEDMLESPNEADAMAFGVDMFRRKGINASIQTPAKSLSSASLDRELRENDFDSRPDCYSEEVGAEEAAFF